MIALAELTPPIEKIQAHFVQYKGLNFLLSGDGTEAIASRGTNCFGPSILGRYGVAMAAGLTTLNLLSEPGFHDALAEKTTRLLDGLTEAAHAEGVAFTTAQAGAMFGMFFTDQSRISGFADVMACDSERFNRFFHAMLDQGIYLAPSAFEAGFVSAAHSDEDIAATIAAARKAFATV